MPFSFRFRLLPFIATLVVVAIGMALGQWQVRRAHEKEAIERTIIEREATTPLRLDGEAALNAGADAMESRQVALRGQFQRG